MTSIGGFFGLEKTGKGKKPYHPSAIALNTGRACLSAVIKQQKPKKIYVPYYTCDALLEPLVRYKIEFAYYEINEKLDPITCPKLSDGEYFIYINYFGLKGKTAQALMKQYGPRLIVDNTQAFFERGTKNTWSFNSARKFFGVPDGAYVYGPLKRTQWLKNKKPSVEHLKNRLLEKSTTAYQQFVRYERSLDCTIKTMSDYSRNILKHVDYSTVIRRRKANFQYLHRELKHLNTFKLRGNSSDVPFCYPLLPSIAVDKAIFHARNLFIPTLWPRALRTEPGRFHWERDFAKRLLPLPVDHRYGTDDLKIMVDAIKRIL